jgi:hypothetical protein
LPDQLSSLRKAKADKVCQNARISLWLGGVLGRIEAWRLDPLNFYDTVLRLKAYKK